MALQRLVDAKACSPSLPLSLSFRRSHRAVKIIVKSWCTRSVCKANHLGSSLQKRDTLTGSTTLQCFGHIVTPPTWIRR
eukprot:2978642-Pleurochrysis_carterae.AAC.1